MTVKDLIKYLQTMPQNIPVAYRLYSEQCLLEVDDIQIKNLQFPREDGWISDSRREEEAPTQPYLVLPGN